MTNLLSSRKKNFPIKRKFINRAPCYFAFFIKFHKLIFLIKAKFIDLEELTSSRKTLKLIILQLMQWQKTPYVQILPLVSPYILRGQSNISALCRKRQRLLNGALTGKGMGTPYLL